MKSKKVKKFKFTFSLTKEKIWLEQMSLEGLFLENVRFGCFFTFDRAEPKHMIYEVDRFNLSKHPSLSEIRHKEEFFSVAREMGWEPVCHDEDLNYYFYKEYREDDINELYNDSDARRIHASKYQKHYNDLSNHMMLWVIFCICSVLYSLYYNYDSRKDLLLTLFPYIMAWFSLFFAVFSFVYRKLGTIIYNEFILDSNEWKKRQNTDNQKIVYKLVLRTSTLKRFLRKESLNGWHLKKMYPIRYIFYRDDPEDYSYTLDTKYLTNQRLALNDGKKYSFSKDCYCMNNDWQIQSLTEAEQKNWTFVCALQNRAIIYRSISNRHCEPLNDAKYEKRVRFTSIVGPYTILLLISGCIGGLIGGIFAFFGI